MQTMQRFLKENYRKNLSVKIIHINSVMYLKMFQPFFFENFKQFLRPFSNPCILLLKQRMKNHQKHEKLPLNTNHDISDLVYRAKHDDVLATRGKL